MILGKSVDVKSRVKFSMQISGLCNVSRFLQLCLNVLSIIVDGVKITMRGVYHFL